MNALEPTLKSYRCKRPKLTTWFDDLQSLISKEKKPSKPTQPNYNHPIDWEVINLLSDSTIAAVKTSNRFDSWFYKNLAPGSVANFVTLADSNFYNQKVFTELFHFVIQTGCPRGDGYGGLDYSIRTKFLWNIMMMKGM